MSTNPSRSKKKVRPKTNVENAPSSSSHPIDEDLVQPVPDGEIGSFNEAALELITRSTSLLITPLEAISKIPSLAMTNALQGISQATSGLFLQNFNIHNVLFDAVRRSLANRRGFFSIASSSSQSTPFINKEVEEIDIDDDAETVETSTFSPKRFSNSSSLYEGFYQELDKSFHPSNIFLDSNSKKHNSQLLIEYKNALNLLNFFDNFNFSDPRPESADKETLATNLVVFEKGCEAAKLLSDILVDKIAQLQKEKEELNAAIITMSAMKDKLKSHTETSTEQIPIEVSDLELESVSKSSDIATEELNTPNSETLKDSNKTKDLETLVSKYPLEPQVEPAPEVKIEIDVSTPIVEAPEICQKRKRLPQSWRAHDSAVTSLCKDHKSNLLASSSAAGLVSLWSADFSTGLYSLSTTLPSQYESNLGTIHCLKILDGILATGGHDHLVHIWNCRSLIPSDEPQPSLLKVDSFDKEPSSPLLSPIDHPETPPEFEVPAPHLALTLKGHSGFVRCLDVDEKCVISGSQDGTMRQWDLETGKLIASFDPSWTMNSGVVNEYKIRYWDAIAGRGLHVEALGSSVGALKFFGRALCSGTADGLIRLWDVRTGQAHRSLAGHTGPVTSLSFDSIHLVSGSLDHTVRVWDIRTGKVLEQLKYARGISSIQFNSDFVFSACEDNELQVYERKTFQKRELSVHSFPTWSTHLDQDSGLFSGDQGGDICVTYL